MPQASSTEKGQHADATTMFKEMEVLATLWHNYIGFFSNPWDMIGFSAAWVIMIVIVIVCARVKLPKKSQKYRILK